MDPSHQAEPPISPSHTASLLPLIKEVSPWLYALALGTIYVSGFLVLNANLVKSGVFDIEFVDARYFLAAASFVFYLVCFYLFAGRAVLFTPKWLREDLERMNKDGPKPLWSFVVFIHSLITGTFFCCLSAALFTSFAIGSSETATFYITLSGAFLILYTFDVANIDIKYPKFSEVTTILAKLIAIYAFFIHVGTGAMWTAFLSYVVIFFFINLVLDSFNRFKITTDRITFFGIYAVVILLGTAVSFGTLFYGQVASRLGGASPQMVSLGLTEDARKALPASFAGLSGQILEGKLVHQTPAYTYITSSGHTLRMRTSDVITLVTTIEPENISMMDHFKSAASAPKSSKPLSD